MLFFKKEQLKGNLPASGFGEMAKQDSIRKITEMRQALAHYLDNDSQMLMLRDDFMLNERKILLTTTMARVYGDDIVFWRVGGLRDKDRIQAWVYHLLATLYLPDKNIKFYYREGEQVGLLCFAPLSQEEAKEQLAIYLNAYVSGFSQPQLVVYDNWGEYLGAKSPDPENAMEDLADGREGRYLNRILAQSRQLNYPAIHQRTLDWFGLMNRKVINES